MRHTFGIVLLLAIASFSCSKKEKTTYKLFNVDSLIHAQVQYLSSQHAVLNKTSSLDDSTSTLSFTPKDTAAWKSELEIFNVLNLINKPINQNSYVIENQSDTRSNLWVKTFTIKANLPIEEKDLPIEYLKVYYQNSMDKIRKIEGRYRESSTMYKTTQILEIELQPVKDEMILSSYSISGGQKMFLGDSVQYKIISSVTLSK